MLNTIKKSLIFPKLVIVDHIIPKRYKKKVPLYKLDWSYKEEQYKIAHEKWAKECYPDKDLPFFGNLPEYYDNWIKNLRFTINGNYLMEIHRCSRMAVDEWSRDRSFDTVIREMCLEPAQSFIKVAFKLIADCMYDGELNDYYRKNDKWIADIAMIYKFWMNQTGSGLPTFFSGLYELEKKNDLSETESKFIKAMRELQNDIRGGALKFSCEKEAIDAVNSTIDEVVEKTTKPEKFVYNLRCPICGDSKIKIRSVDIFYITTKN